MRTPLLAIVAVAAAAAVAAGPAAGVPALQTDQGIVQTVLPRLVVLRQLDGALVNVRIGPATRIVVDGAPSTLASVQPGFGAKAVHTPGRRARTLWAYTLRERTFRGEIVGIGETELALRRPTGVVALLALGPLTQYQLDGVAVGREALAPGLVAIVTGVRGQPLTIVQAFHRVRRARESAP